MWYLKKKKNKYFTENLTVIWNLMTAVNIIYYPTFHLQQCQPMVVLSSYFDENIYFWTIFNFQQ